jgi:iron complex outermembrane receptor protein
MKIMITTDQKESMKSGFLLGFWVAAFFSMTGVMAVHADTPAPLLRIVVQPTSTPRAPDLMNPGRDAAETSRRVTNEEFDAAPDVRLPDAIAREPGVLIENNTASSRGSKITMRGNSAINVIGAADPPVGVHLDGVYIPRTAGRTLDLFEVSHIDVVRGPTGTTSGHNTMAGDVRIHTRSPGGAESAEARVAVGNHGFHRVEARFDLPLANGSTRTSLAVSGQERRGTVDNLATGDPVNTLDDRSIVGQAQHRFMDGTLVRLILDHTRRTPVGGNIGDFDDILDLETNLVDVLDERHDINGLSMSADTSLGSLALRSTTGLRGFNYEGESSATTGMDLANQATHEDQWQFSQEFVLDDPLARDLVWRAGALFLHERYRLKGERTLRDDAGLFGLPVGASEISRSDLETTDVGVFADGEWFVGRGLSLFAGARAIHVDRDFSYDYRSTEAVGLLAPIQTLDENRSWTDWMGRVGARYRMGRNAMAYGVLRRGFNAGGFDGALVGDSDAEFGEETSLDYEIGLKTNWLEDSISLDAALFQADIRDKQVEVNSVLTYDTLNANHARARGVEVTGSAAIGSGVRLTASGAYLDAVFGSFRDRPDPAGSSTSDLSGNRLPLAPRWSYKIGADVTQTLENLPGARLFARAGWRWQSSTFFDIDNTLRQGSYGVLDLQAGLDGGRWSVRAFGRNVLDERYRAAALAGSAFGGPFAVVADPATFGVEFRVRF